LSFLNWAKHKLAMRAPTDPQLKARAQEELAEVGHVINDVFDKNLTVLMQEIAQADLLADIMVAGSDYESVNDMFMRGVLLEFLSDRPPLPTEPVDRASLYAIGFFVKSHNMTLDNARERVHRTLDLHNRASELYDWILERGRVAYREGGDRHLIACQAAAVGTALSP
jgi:hypothetical protein